MINGEHRAELRPGGAEHRIDRAAGAIAEEVSGAYERYRQDIKGTALAPQTGTGVDTTAAE